MEFRVTGFPVAELAVAWLSECAGEKNPDKMRRFGLEAAAEEAGLGALYESSSHQPPHSSGTGMEAY